MKAKTIFIIIISILVTIILMKNTEEVKFWVFSEIYVSKLAVMGVLFALGLIVGLLLGRPRRKKAASELLNGNDHEEQKPGNTLTDHDREYIS